MAQFDVYRMDNGELVLDLQTDLLGNFGSRIVVPLLLPEEAPVAHPRLNPTLYIDEAHYVMVTQFMVSVRANELARPVGNLLRSYDAIKSALDMIFLGF